MFSMLCERFSYVKYAKKKNILFFHLIPKITSTCAGLLLLFIGISKILFLSFQYVNHVFIFNVIKITNINVPNANELNREGKLYWKKEFLHRISNFFFFSILVILHHQVAVIHRRMLNKITVIFSLSLIVFFYQDSFYTHVNQCIFFLILIVTIITFLSTHSYISFSIEVNWNGLVGSLS